MAQKIKILSFGRSRKDVFDSEIERFAKMSRSWAAVEFVTLKPVDASNESVDVALKRESEMLQKHWSGNTYIISLAEEGKLMNSYQFADLLQKRAETGAEIVFNIGSAYGLSDDVKQKSNMLISLSPMTMPYKLCKLMFAEQIYRALAINNNHPYHKE